MAFSANAENFSLSSDVIRRVSKELKELIEEPLESISILVNDKDITDVQCIVEGPAGTPYAGGHFRVKLSMPKDFPHSPPRGYFLTRIFHPNVAPTSGEICVNTLKKDWKPEYGIRHVLLTVKCLLIVPNAESALNEEAGKLLLEQYDEYAKRAKMMTEIHARAPKEVESSSASKHDATSSKSAVSSSSHKRPATADDDGASACDSTSANGGGGDDQKHLLAKKAKERSKKMLKRL